MASAVRDFKQDRLANIHNGSIYFRSPFVNEKRRLLN
jgi:hypothetical protein